MIPVRLELTNFLSYRNSAELDFNGIMLACIAGMNGAGKSTILDSITWALFGKSRSKSDDDVVNRIAARESGEAQVIFDFELEQVIYRVIRRKKYSRTMSVEFQVASDYEAGHWKSLTKARRRETDQVIEDLLRMNYDTFSNASFLLQGKADEFTTKTAGRRKEILADLLGVNTWDKYRDAAATRRKSEENRIVLIDGQIGEIERELAQEDVRKAELGEAQAKATQITQELNSKEILLHQTRQTADLIEQQQKQVHSLQNALDRAKRQLNNLEQSKTKQQAERDNYNEILAQADNISQQYGAWQAADKAAREWQIKADSYNQLQVAKQPYELTIAQTQSRLEQQKQTLLDQEKRVDQMKIERVTVEEQAATAQKQLTKTATLLEAFVQDEAAYQVAREQLQQEESARNLLRQECQQLQQQATGISQRQQERATALSTVKTASTALAKVTQQLAALDSQQAEIIQLQNQISGLEAEQPLLKEQMNLIKERMDQLQAADAEGACPLCGQQLSHEHKTAVLTDLQIDGKEKGDRFRHNRAILPTLNSRVTELTTAVQQKAILEKNQQAQQQRLTSAETRIPELNQSIEMWETSGARRLTNLEQQLGDESTVHQLQQKIHVLEKKLQGKSEITQQEQAVQRTLTQTESRLAEIDRTVTEWESTGVIELSTIATQLSTESFELTAREALSQLDADAAVIEYDSVAHTEVKQTRIDLQDAPERFRLLEKGQTAVTMLDENLANIAKQLVDQITEVGERESEFTTAETALKALNDGSSVDLRTLEKEVQTLREAQIEVNRLVGRATQNLEVLGDQRARLKDYANERSSITQQITRLKRLEKACGRDGIQGLLIEYAVPDIEETANEILERLTDGRMRVEFSTQRQLKSRDAVAETLDINIADESGIRPYENFSGGEQFRVNFAVRIALSKILAKRAGARLQTLVIDEGFGSQDPDGRQRLIEAIKAIQDDFKCILIITHIASLRDAFPTQINVFKTATGSQISVE